MKKNWLILAALTALTVHGGELTLNWRGKAEKVSAPKVENITENGKSFVRCTPTGNAPWQGFIAIPSEKQALSKYKAVSFEIRQSCKPGNVPTVIYLHTSNGNIYTSFNASGEWRKIEIPLTAARWQNSDKAGFDGTLSRIYLYPYQALDAPGKTLEISDFKFIPAN